MAGDLRDRVSLDAACVGTSAVIETAAAMPFAFAAGVNDIDTTDIAGVEGLIDAASDAGSLAGLMRRYAKGDAVPMDESARTFGVQLMTVREFAETTLGKGPQSAG